MLADPEMRALAEEELPRLKARIPRWSRRCGWRLLPKDAADARPAILEIRPGTGGDEAALVRGRSGADVSALCRADGLALRGAGASRLATWAG
jgi:hypothetical protein